MLLKLDFAGEVPIYLQIRNQIVHAIADGTLSPGERLPAIRALALEAGINMMTVSKAYQILRDEGYIETDRRRGAVVTDMSHVGEMPLKTQKSLKLAISEAKLAGVSKGELLDHCALYYDETEVKS